MALSLVLVFRPVSPLSGHSHVAGRRGRPTLSPGLGPVRHTSLEFQSQKLFLPKRKRKSNTAAASLPPRTRSSQPPPPITIDAAVGRHALVPASIWPTYTCSEHDGRGWEVKIRHADKRIRAVLVSFISDRNAVGKRYPKEWLLLESLLPL